MNELFEYLLFRKKEVCAQLFDLEKCFKICFYVNRKPQVFFISSNFEFLDCHHVWRSYDPTSIQTFDFCEKRISTPSF